MFHSERPTAISDINAKFFIDLGIKLLQIPSKHSQHKAVAGLAHNPSWSACPACFDSTYKGRKNSTLPKRRAFKPVDKGKFENTHQFIVQPSSELLTKITGVPGIISLSQHGSALSTVVTVNTLSLSYEYACAITIRCLLRIYYTSDARGPNCWYSILTYRTKCLLLHNQF
ncbi:hypothetical protein L798_05065 [Zootermopsis nevadensis]|uniref:Uncharacterized protein n=1 Tax=Zootermopsis nevadensis TaxID=136037 RepID=A0A067RIK8_ZOONE|nr:hypothetical protein L798_05065 [Zootermopsis nevadensis]